MSSHAYKNSVNHTIKTRAPDCGAGARLDAESARPAACGRAPPPPPICNVITPMHNAERAQRGNIPFLAQSRDGSRRGFPRYMRRTPRPAVYKSARWALRLNAARAAIFESRHEGTAPALSGSARRGYAAPRFTRPCPPLVLAAGECPEAHSTASKRKKDRKRRSVCPRLQ
jgi:hypothetical protein